jgi:hypothetical protein
MYNESRGIRSAAACERPATIISDFSSYRDFPGDPQKHQVRAAGNIRVLLFGWIGNAAARKATRPVATGTFAFPAFGRN